MTCRKNGKPIMNLSSSQSEDESDTENPQDRIPMSHIPVVAARPVHPNYQSMHSRKQFSTTMTLDDSRTTDYEGVIQTLKTENQHLRHEVGRLENQNGQLRRHLHEKGEESEKTISQLEQQLEDAQKKVKRAQKEAKKIEKECENKLKDRELAGQLRPDPIAKQVHSLTEGIKQTCQSMLSELSKQNMNIVVEQIITKHVNELGLLNAGPVDEKSSSKVSTRFNNHWREEPATPNPRPIAKDITDEYRMLEKSIEKLKTMEKDIGEAGGNYLRRQPLVELNHNRSRTATCMLNQSTVSNSDRSKSRRKRIFQN